MKARYDLSNGRQAFLQDAYDADTTRLQCALCESTETTLLAENDEARVLICSTCSLAYLAPRLSKEGYARLYREYFQDARRSLATFGDAVARLRKKGAYENKLPLVETFRGAIPKGGRGLEIGGGWGTLAKAFEDKIGCTIEVVEPSLLASRVAREYYGLTVYEQEVEPFLQNAPDCAYDFILLVHVFEHLPDPNTFLMQAVRVLRPAGKLLLALPDLSRPDEPSGRYFHVEHCYYYTPKTLELMLRKHGFAVEAVRQDPHDMKVVAAYTDTRAIPDYRNDERQAIRASLALLDATYGVLRLFKQVLNYLLPTRLFASVQRAAVRLLKKSGIII